MTQTQHTPTPYCSIGESIFAGNELIAVVPIHLEANAEFIVRACNSFNEMLEVLIESEEHSQKRLPVKKSTWLKMRAAIKKARGEI